MFQQVRCICDFMHFLKINLSTMLNYALSLHVMKKTKLQQ